MLIQTQNPFPKVSDFWKGKACRMLRIVQFSSLLTLSKVSKLSTRGFGVVAFIQSVGNQK